MKLALCVKPLRNFVCVFGELVPHMLWPACVLAGLVRPFVLKGKGNVEDHFVSFVKMILLVRSLTCLHVICKYIFS